MGSARDLPEMNHPVSPHRIRIDIAHSIRATELHPGATEYVRTAQLLLHTFFTC